MNSCEIETGKAVRKETAGMTLDELNKFKQDNNISDQWFNIFIKSGERMTAENPAVQLTDIFKIRVGNDLILDTKSLYDFKYAIISKLMSAIFMSSEVPFELNNRNIDDVMNVMILQAKAALGINSESDAANWYYNNLLFADKRAATIKDTDKIVNFFIATQLPTLVKAYMGEIMGYDDGLQKYVYANKSHVKKDWNSTIDEKPAELNGLLKLLCTATPMIGKDEHGNDKELKGMVLTQNSFMWAWNQWIKRLDDEDYKKIIDDPHYGITLLQQMVFDPAPLEEGELDPFSRTELQNNILYSFAKKWLDPSKNFYKAFGRHATGATDYNPIEIIVANIKKHSINTYVEYSTDSSKSYLNLEFDDGGTAYQRLIDNLQLNKTTLFEACQRSGLITEEIDGNKVKYIPIKFNSNTVPTENQIAVLKLIFGPRLQVTSDSYSQINNALELFNIFVQSEQDKIAPILSSDAIAEHFNGQKPSTILTAIIKNAVRYNPYAIEGAIKNANDKALPTIGLASVGSSIEEMVCLNKIHLEESQAAYEAARSKEGGNRIFMPVSPFAHSFLSKQQRNDATEFFKRTVYTSTLTGEADGETIIKDPADFSKPEMFELTIVKNIIDVLYNGKGDDLIIQAITPSDKSKIPNFIFSKKGFLTRYLGKETINTNDNETLFNTMCNQIKLYYWQYLLNTCNDFIQVFNLNSAEFKSKYDILDIKLNAADVDLNYLKHQVDSVNRFLSENNINVTKLNDTVFAFNREFGLNKNIAEHLDYNKTKNGYIQIARFSKLAAEEYSKQEIFEKIFLDSLSKFPAEFKIKIGTSSDGQPKYETVNDLFTVDESGNRHLKSNFKNSQLFTFFVVQNLLSTEILVNTVGLPNAHKASGDDFFQIDSSGQITMVKRMVALTATMQQCNRNVLGGLPNKMKMMTISNEVIPMFSMSGTTTDDRGFENSLEAWDGAMIGTRISHNQCLQSIGDTKPYGNDLKLIMHDFNAEKGASHLPKLASYAITNSLIRVFSDENMKRIKARDPEMFLLLQLRNAKINLEDFATNGFIDYNGNTMKFNQYMKLIDDNGNEQIVKSIFKLNGDHLMVMYKDANTGQFITDEDGNRKIVNCGTDLYSIWKYVFGGAYSCDKDGNFNEESQDNICVLLNKIGNIYEGVDDVRTQKDVDQYLKKDIVYFFPTESVQKSLKAPVANIHTAVEDANKAYTLEYDIEKFGLQMDADHEAEDSTIHEITQLISFISDHGYVPHLTKSVYKNLADLIVLMGKNVFIDIDKISDPQVKEETQQKLDNLFGQMITRSMTDPNLDIKSYANELLSEIKNITDLKVPYSDHQVLNKLHTTIGSYLNKFIARNWTGRADVLMPSHNMFMVYEDENGNRFMPSDFKQINGQKLKISKYLSNFMWNENGTLSNAALGMVASGYEFMPGDTYYRIPMDTYQTITKDEAQIVELNSYQSLKDASEEVLSNQYIYIKALDVPRNLRAKRVYLSVKNKYGEKQLVGFYHLNIMKQLANIGNLITSTSDVNERTRLINEKKKIQKNLDDNILPILSKLYARNTELTGREINILNEQLPEELQITNSLDIDYVSTDSETLETNNYANVFGDPNMNIAEIKQTGPKYFIDKLRTRFNQDVTMPNTNVMYSLYTSKGDVTQVVNKATWENNLNANYIRVTPIVNEDGFRVTNSGKIMYKLPEDAEIYKIGTGDSSFEIIVTDHIIDPDKNGVALQDNRFWLFYKKHGPNYTKINGMYELSNNAKDNEQLFKIVGEKQYQSFIQSLTEVVARIPSQSLAFGMDMETVGYLPFRNNLRIVPLEHFYLQGSDVDIDKAYAIMANIGYDGLYTDSSFNVKFVKQKNQLSEESLETNNMIIQLANLPQLDMGSILNLITAHINKYGKLEINEDYIKDNLLQLNKKRIIPIDNLIRTMSFINERLMKQSSMQVNVLQNEVHRSLIDVYHDPRTIYAANSPTTMVEVQEAVAESGAEKELRNSLDPTTNILVNQTCSVGKKGVGISANSQKAFYALTTYYEVLRENGMSVLKPTEFGSLPKDWRLNGKEYLSTLGFAGARVNRETMNQLREYFSPNTETFQDTNLEGNLVNKGIELAYKNGIIYRRVFESDIATDELIREKVEIAYVDPRDFQQKNKRKKQKEITSEDIATNPFDYTKYISSWQEIKEGGDISDITCTLINGAIISSATDNAKEMKMDLLNMTPEVLPAYEYLLSLGISIKQASKILLDRLIPELVILAKGNLYNKQKSMGRLSKVITRVNSNDELKAKLGVQLGYDMETMTQKLTILTKIFQGADELTALSQGLSINGGIDVTMGAPLIYQLKFEKRINDKFPRDVHAEFSLEQFAYDRDYANLWVDQLQNYTSTYNVLAVMSTVDHFYSMLQVPIQFKRIMSQISGDMRIAYNWFEKHNFGKDLSEKNIKKIVKAINDTKIVNFLKLLEFKYDSYLQYNLNNNSVSNNSSVISTDSINKLNTKTNEGILTLKNHIEKVIYPLLLEKYGNNDFVKNLCFNTFIWDLAQRPVSALASAIDLTSSQNEQEAVAIKTKYDEIKNLEIGGHTIHEWMFLYDLIVYKHQLGRNSFSSLFGNINEDTSNIERKWVEYINNYDENVPTDNGTNNLYSLPFDLDYAGEAAQSYSEPGEETYGWQCPNWVDIKTLPMFVQLSKHSVTNFKNITIVNELFKRGVFLVNIC